MKLLSEHDLDCFKAEIDAAADEHAERALEAIVADFNLLLERHDAFDEDNPVRQWAVCILVKALGKKMRNQT